LSLSKWFKLLVHLLKYGNYIVCLNYLYLFVCFFVIRAFSHNVSMKFIVFLHCREVQFVFWYMDPKSFRTSLLQYELSFYWRSTKLYEEWAAWHRISILEVETTWLWYAPIWCREISRSHAGQNMGIYWWLNSS